MTSKNTETYAHIGYPDLGSPSEFGWKQDSVILVHVYFEGQSASHLVNSQKCDCSHRQMCSTGCKCYLTVNAPMHLIMFVCSLLSM